MAGEVVQETPSAVQECSQTSVTPVHYWSVRYNIFSLWLSCNIMVDATMKTVWYEKMLCNKHLRHFTLVSFICYLHRAVNYWAYSFLICNNTVTEYFHSSAAFKYISEVHVIYWCFWNCFHLLWHDADLSAKSPLYMRSQFYPILRLIVVAYLLAQFSATFYFFFFT